MNFQTRLRHIPFFNICLFYILGVILANSFIARNSLILYGVPLLSGIAISLVIVRLSGNVWGNIQRIIVYILLVCCGISSYGYFSDYTELPAVEREYGAIAASPVVRKEKYIQVDCRLFKIDSIESKTLSKDKVRLHLEIDSLSKIPEMGDSIFFTGLLSRIKNAGNPDEFDYVNYLSREKIYYGGYIKRPNYFIGEYSGKFWLKRVAHRVQELSVKRLQESGIEGNELAVLSALATGYRDLLNSGIMSDYAATGAMHILSVSGLHVGILFMFLNILLGSRNNLLYYRMVKILVILTLIWFYAFVSGLSSPVIRASVMFSLFLLGKNFNRYINSYNILAASAFLVLIVNPMELFKVGFQFSYLAVFGILYFQPRMENILVVKNGLLDRTWQLITVSVAAQITTFPLGLFYFHQFPVCFLLTNLVVIPATWAIMMLTLIFYVSLPLSFLSAWVAYVLNLLMKITNWTIGYIADLSFAVITDIRFGTIHLVCWSLVIVIISVYWFHSRITGLLYLSSAIILFILAFDLVEYQENNRKREVLIYNVRRNTAISLIDGHNQLFLTDGFSDSSWVDKSKYIKPYWISRQIHRDIVWLPLEGGNDEIVMIGEDFKLRQSGYGSSMIFFDLHVLYLQPLKYYDIKNMLKQPDSADIILVNRTSGFPRSQYKNLSKPGTVIVGQNLSACQKESWQKFAKENTLEFFDIEEKGAFAWEEKNSAHRKGAIFKDFLY